MTTKPIACWCVYLFAVVALPGSLVRDLHAAAPQSTGASIPAPQPAQQRAILDKYCATCHNQRLKAGGLVLDSLDINKIPDHAETWEKVVRKARARMMPPVGLPRPTDVEYDSVVSYLTTTIDDSAKAAPNPGRVATLRRLNRTEYKNALRDLLALDIDADDLLPSDDSSGGFDNISLGGLDPGRLERYLTAAKKVSRVAVGAPAPAPGGRTVTVPSDLPQNGRMEGLPFGTRGGTQFSHTFPLDADYEFQIRLGRGSAGGGVVALTEPHDIVLLVDGQIVKTFTVLPVRGETDGGGMAVRKDADADLNLRAPIAAGPHVVSAAFLSKGTVLSEKQRKPFQRLHVTVSEDQRTQPTMYSVTVLGPFGASGSGSTPSRQRIFTCQPAAGVDDATCAKKIISTLARRAYRRPVTDEDLQPLLSFYRDGRAAGGFEGGIENALRWLLVSPQFLIRVTRDPEGVKPGAPYRLSDLEIASRLSFFLWSSIPDSELLDVAARGQLKNPAVLDRQVRRMLADSRSDTLVTNFAAQWLYLRNLPAVRPDAVIFPDFDQSLRENLRTETELFIQSILREDRSAVELLSADYTFLNERLAKHYGIPNVYGNRFRRYSFPANSPRGGLLGQGSILTVTAYANRTSPVIRGKWVLQNILGTPPPPPPPNVPPLSDTKNSRTLSMRERMAAHRANPVCASCHGMMDPIGLSMENFDATGGWRSHTESFAPLDVSGRLPNGTAYEGIGGLKKALLAHPDQFVGTLTERLLTYAIGRPVEYYDMPAVRSVIRESAASNYRFSSLILGIVKSTPFQMRMSDATDATKEPVKSVAAR